MLKISKLVDHGALVLSNLPHKSTGFKSASYISNETNLSLPNVSKILKLMHHGNLVYSVRGSKGGYALNKKPEEITAAEILTALEGPIAITECISEKSSCNVQNQCGVSYGWQRINNIISHALNDITLRDLQEKPIKFTN
jgi:FeS assembly SUF system regulator